MTTWIRHAEPVWYPDCPNVFDIVASWWPGDPKAELRPCLVVGRATNALGQHMVRVHYGTTNLKADSRGHRDLLVTDPRTVAAFGLRYPTRFDLETRLDLTYNDAVFGCVAGRRTPVIGALDAEAIAEVRRKRRIPSERKP